MLRNYCIAVIFINVLSACDSSGERECFNLEMKAWEQQRSKDELVIKKIESLWQSTEHKIGSVIFHNSDYIQASSAAKNEIFRRLVATDKNYFKADDATKFLIQQKFEVDGNAFKMQMESKDSARARIFKECKKISPQN